MVARLRQLPHLYESVSGRGKVFKHRPRYIGIQRPPLVGGRFFVVCDQGGGDGRGEFQATGRLCVGGSHVEGVEDRDQLVLVGLPERLAHVGHRVEHRGDLVGVGAFGALGAQRGDGLLYCFLAGGWFLDAAGGERDDGVVGVVVLLQSQGLAVEAALHVALLMAQPLKLGVVVLPRGGGRLGQFGTQEPQAVGAEDAAAEEVEHRVED